MREESSVMEVVEMSPHVKLEGVQIDHQRVAVFVKDINIPFGSMVREGFKWGIAGVVVAIALVILPFVAVALLGGFANMLNAIVGI